MLDPSVRALVTVNNTGKRVGLVHIQARARNRSGRLGLGGSALGGGKLKDLPPRLGGSGVLDADCLGLHSARQCDGLGGRAVDIAGLDPRTSLVLILEHAGIDAIARGGLVAAARSLNKRESIDLGRLGERQGHRSAWLRGIANVILGITRIEILVLQVSIRRNITVVDVGERLRSQDLAVDGHRACNRLALGSLLFLIDLDLVDRRPSVAAVILRGDEANAIDALDVQAGNGDGRASQIALALNVIPVLAIIGLELGMLHIVSAIALNKGHVGQIERLVLDHAKVRTRRELVGGLVDNARVGLTVKDVLDLALGSVGTAGHKLRGIGIGVGS